jgi:lipoprotein-anchoring transpeptidase ErfK/SrfK
MRIQAKIGLLSFIVFSFAVLLIGNEATAVSSSKMWIATLTTDDNGFVAAPVFAEPTESQNEIATLGGPDGLAPVALITEMPENGWAHAIVSNRAEAAASQPLSGWIPTDKLVLSEVKQQITVDRKHHRLTVSRNGRVVRSMRAAVGQMEAPTPAVTTFVVGVYKPTKPFAPLGPFVLHLAAWSATIPKYAVDSTWDGIAIHGTNCPKTCLGKSITNGSVRVSNDNVSWLARYIEIGTPVKII